MNAREVQQDNLDDLVKVFLDDTGARRAWRALEAARATDAEASSPLLESDLSSNSMSYGHTPLDALLTFYSIVEIACQTSYVSNALPDELIRTAYWSFSQRAVEAYRDKHPAILPILFRLRLARELQLSENIPSDPTTAHQLFSEFLGMVDRLNNDDTLRIFISLLQGRRVDRYGVADVLALLNNPQELSERVLKSEVAQDTLDVALHGFQSFLGFCLEFDDLLQRCQPYPLLQSSQFHYFAHLFEYRANTIRKCVNDGMASLLRSASVVNDSQDSQFAAEIQEYAQSVQGALKRLVFGSYGVILQDRLTQYDPTRSARAADVEKNIEQYQTQLAATNRAEMPFLWHRLMANLALCYGNRVLGERTDNLEYAVQLYEQLLEKTTRESMPVEWARTCADLANTYEARVQGDRGENMERAISLYRQALTVISRDQLPMDWLVTVIGLADAYQSRIRGQREDNLQQVRELRLALKSVLHSHLRLSTVLDSTRSTLADELNRWVDVLKRIYQYLPDNNSDRIWDFLDYDDIQVGAAGTCALYRNEEVVVLDKNKEDDRHVIQLFQQAKADAAAVCPLDFSLDLDRATMLSTRMQRIA